MLFIFEMANNHMGSVAHGRRIIDEFSSLAKQFDINAAIKFQFRQLQTFIHPDYIDSDLKYVKRFRETELTKENYHGLARHAKSCGLKTVATPFDNDSIAWLEDLDISVVKIASCSIDDWPLLEEVATLNKRLIVSTAGADLGVLHRVYDLLKQAHRDFAFMHCVGEYPTPPEHAHLGRINTLRNEFPDIEIGFSTHESPRNTSLSPAARAMGCTIIEKHVAIKTDEYGINDYSCTPEQMSDIFGQLNWIEGALTGYSGDEKTALKSLKRGIYLRKDIDKGEMIERQDVFFAMPLQDGQYDVSDIRDVDHAIAIQALSANAPLLPNAIKNIKDDKMIQHIKRLARELLREAGTSVTADDRIEISCHYGLQQFLSTGVLIVEKVNREYCKKLLVIFSNQKHPTHRHIRKEESFELIHGDCTLTLHGKEVSLQLGKPVLIERGVNHSFRSKKGAVVEEVSTKHLVGDSVYENPVINKLDISERKIEIAL